MFFLSFFVSSFVCMSKIPVSFAMHLSVKEGSLEKTLDYSHHESTPPTGATVSDEADNKRAKVTTKFETDLE